MTKNEEIKLLYSHLKALQRGAEGFWEIIEDDLLPACSDINQERIARIADKYGFDGELIRNSMPADYHPLSIEAYKRLEEVITILPKVIAAIEQHVESATIPEGAELLNRKQVALMLGWGESVVTERDKRGLMPMSRKVGGSVHWGKAELLNWIDAGLPDRQTWENLKQARKGA